MALLYDTAGGYILLTIPIYHLEESIGIWTWKVWIQKYDYAYNALAATLEFLEYHNVQNFVGITGENVSLC